MLQNNTRPIREETDNASDSLCNVYEGEMTPVPSEDGTIKLEDVDEPLDTLHLGACMICLSRPAVMGYAHQGILHICVCKRCANGHLHEKYGCANCGKPECGQAVFVFNSAILVSNK